MNSNIDRTFGIVIAYVIPGLVCLGGVAPFSPTVTSWLSAPPSAEPTVGGFFYVILGSLACGLTVSALRWATIDTIHHHTGLPYPNFDFSKLPNRLEAFQVAVDHYYRYYQFHANMAVALITFAICRQSLTGIWPAWQLGLLAALVILLLATSRDSLGRYYTRAKQLLS